MEYFFQNSIIFILNMCLENYNLKGSNLVGIKGIRLKFYIPYQYRI